MNQQRRGPQGRESTPFDLATFAWVLGYCSMSQSESGPEYMNEEALTLKEQDGHLWFQQWEPESPGKGPVRPALHVQAFQIPRTIGQAYDYAVQAGIWDDSPEERQDFFRTYALMRRSTT
jgi:hypothetical protein